MQVQLTYERFHNIFRQPQVGDFLFGDVWVDFGGHLLKALK